MNLSLIDCSNEFNIHILLAENIIFTTSYKLYELNKIALL